MALSFSKKAVRLTFTLGQGNFSGQGNTKIIQGLACEASIEKPGLPDKNSARIKVSGISLESLEQLTSLSFRPLESQRNIVTIEAGIENQELLPIFTGEITSAWADFASAPDPALCVEASTGSYPQKTADPPMSLNGEERAASILAQLAEKMGYSFSNEGVGSSLFNAVFNGDLFKKCLDISRQVGAELLVDDGQVILKNPGTARNGPTILVAPHTGLIGYPSFNQDGVVCRAFFNPALKHCGRVRLESIVPGATGDWRINKLSHSLSAFNPQGGPWESSFEASPL